METENVSTTSRLAIASIMCIPGAIVSILIFSFITFIGAHEIAGVFVATGVLCVLAAFVLGWLSLVVIAIWHRQLKGAFLAILAIILSAVPMYFICGAWLGVRARAEIEKANVGTYNLRLLGKSLVAYAKNHQGLLPDSNRWCDLLMQDNGDLTKDNFRHPKPERLQLRGECHFAFNKKLGGMRLADVPGNVVLVFEADGDWNLSGTGELLRTRYRDQGYIAILFVDQGVSDYWYYVNAVRKFDKSGKAMYYEKPRWQP